MFHLKTLDIFKTMDKWYAAHGPRYAFRLGPEYWGVNIAQAKDMEVEKSHAF